MTKPEPKPRTVTVQPHAGRVLLISASGHSLSIPVDEAWAVAAEIAAAGRVKTTKENR